MANWRRWGPILFGVGVLLVFLAIGALIFGISWVRDHVVIEDARLEAVDASLDEIRTRFGGRAPLIEAREGTVRRSELPADAKPVSLSTLHVLVWDADDEKMARIDLPFWLIRLKSIPLEFGGKATGLREIGITLSAAEIERYGPGIVVDVEMGSGERALIWAE